MVAAKTLRHGLGTRSVRRLRRRSLEQSVTQPVRGLAAVQVFVSKLDNFLGTELFGADQPVIVGRHRDAHLRLVAEAVSREHLRVSVEAGKVFVEDLGSANGSLLNRRRLSGRAEIRPADAIQIGPYTLRVRALIPRPERIASGISDADTSVEAVLAVDGSNGTTDAALDVARAVDWRLYEDAVRRATGGLPARNVIHLSVVGDVPVARARTRSDSQVPVEPMDDEHGGSSAATGRVDTRDVPATSDKLTPPSPITLDAGIVARIEELERLVERWSEPSRVIRAHEDSAVTVRPDEAAIRGLGASLLGASLLGAAVGAPIGDGATEASSDTRAGSITRPDRGDSHLAALAASVLRAEDLLAFTDASDVIEIPIIPDLASDAPSALGAGFSVVPSQAMGTGTHDNPAGVVLEESTERSTEIETATPAGTPTPILERYPSVPMDPAAIARSLLAPAGAHDLGPRGPVSPSRRAPPPPPSSGTGVVLRGIVGAPARGSSVAPAPRVVDPASLAPTPVQSLAPPSVAPEASRPAGRIPAELVTPTGPERAIPLSGAPAARGTPPPVSAQSPSRGTPPPVSAQSPSRGTPPPMSAQSPSRGTPPPVSAQSPSRGTPSAAAAASRPSASPASGPPPRPSAPPARRPSVPPAASPAAASTLAPAAMGVADRGSERLGPKPAAPRLRSLSTPGGSVAAALENAAATPRRRAPSLPPMPTLAPEVPGLRPVSIASARASVSAAERATAPSLVAPSPARPTSAGVFGPLLQTASPVSPSGGNAVVSRSAARAPGAPRQGSVRVTPASPPLPAPPATTGELEAVLTARIAEGDMLFDGVEVVARQGERRLDIATLRKNGEQYVLGHVTPQGAQAPISGHPGLRLLRITDQRMVDLVFPREVAGHLVRDGETVMLRELTEGRKYSCLRLRPRDVITVILGEGAARVSYHVRFLRAPRQISMARPALGA
jgi:hypothetical protein